MKLNQYDIKILIVSVIICTYFYSKDLEAIVKASGELQSSKNLKRVLEVSASNILYNLFKVILLYIIFTDCSGSW